MANIANAQPAKTRAAATQKTEQAGKSTATDRASLMFPTTAVMPEDVVWKRDISRQLDLTKDNLYPVDMQELLFLLSYWKMAPVD